MNVVPGVPPSTSPAVRYVVGLDEAVIPDHVLAVLRGPDESWRTLVGSEDEKKIGIGDDDGGGECECDGNGDAEEDVGMEDSYDVFHYFRWELLPTGLDSSTHATYFKMLLWAEEFRSE